MDAYAATDPVRKREFNSKRYEVQRQIRNVLREKEERKAGNILERLEGATNDSTKYFTVVVRELQRLNPKKRITVTNKNGEVILGEKAKLKTITEYFMHDHHLVEKVNEVENLIKPAKMKEPFTAAEVTIATRKLSSGKSPGPDNIKVELIKWAPPEVAERIAEIYNELAENGKYPEEIRRGWLVPIQKPGKKRGPPENLRPMILLSTLRKILAVVMLNRTMGKLERLLPQSQAAYRRGRSTTEQVAAVKMIAEKAINAREYTANLMFLDMSMAFDCVKREVLLQDLAEVIEDDELHVLAVMVRDVKLEVKMDGNVGEEFKTNVGVPQGDGISPLLFTLYLAQSLKQVQQDTRDHTYYTENRYQHDQQYADDISWVGGSKARLENMEKDVVRVLIRRNLKVNEAKTEKFEVKSGGDEGWRNCKYLGSKLGTDEDIKNRKSLTVAAYTKLRHIFNNKRISRKTKVRVFKTYVEPVFLYNSELWAITKTMGTKIDAFHRRMLRWTIGASWPKKMSNETLYHTTGQKAWTEQIRTRRIRWTGHLLRLDAKTPARIALEESKNWATRRRGRPKNTWLAQMKEDFKQLGVTEVDTQNVHIDS